MWRGHRKIPNVPSSYKDIGFPVSDPRRYMPPSEDACEESEVLDVENVISEQATDVIVRHITDDFVVQSADDKITNVAELPMQKKEVNLPNWLQNWDIKKYNRYFIQIYMLYHFVFLMILWDNSQCYWRNDNGNAFTEIWEECGWYIPVQFIVPYVIYLGVRYFVEIKLKRVANEKK